MQAWSQTTLRLVSGPLLHPEVSHSHFLPIWSTGRACAVSEVTNSVTALLSPRGPVEEKTQTAVSATPVQTLPTGEKKKRKRETLCQQAMWANKLLSIPDSQGTLKDCTEMRN